ncbi:uncharacterized protein MELLADRAFT_101776 [Melampsora larici-populina 98AG31]|uniref:Uncharacterized protein n=1 Tax=Melampsora larici-populina (strain 98AG31 / pathotype 3-4-7) TaxID=747676 RepID=F4R6X7_MELLP|nr:uncharacterized protein MELLADRAFT_101776 [Melampsora larici-populina 98AG31]EGG11948.1 hypothetical protein MELLADRAFT_101776 [Melampsora larici-populina 98AG31]
MNQKHSHQSKRRQSSSSIKLVSKLPKLSSLPRRAYSLAQARDMLGHLNHTRSTSLAKWRPSFPSCHMRPSSSISMTGNQNLGIIPPDLSAQVPPSPWTTHIERLGRESHEALRDTHTPCEVARTSSTSEEDLIMSEIMPPAKRLISLPTTRSLSTTLVGGCNRPLSSRTSSASQCKITTITSRRTPSWKVRRWRTEPRGGRSTGMHESLCVRRLSVFHQESHDKGFEVKIMEECKEPHDIQQRESLEVSSSGIGDDGERLSEHEAESRASSEPSESSLSSLSSSETGESQSERSLPVIELKEAEAKDPQAGSRIAKRNIGPRKSCVDEPPASRLRRSLSTDSIPCSTSRKRDLSEDESEADTKGPDRQTQSLVNLQGQESSFLSKTRSFTPKPMSTSRHLPKSFPAAFKSPMINSTKPKDKTVKRTTAGGSSVVASHDVDQSSQDPSKLKGILLTKKVVELEQTLTLMKDAERILETGDIQSLIDAQNKSAAEYLFKVSGAAQPSKQTDRSGGYEVPTTTHWGDSWGFMAPVSDTAAQIDEQRKLEMFQRGYVSDHADDDLPDEDSLFSENSVRKYDCSGAVIEDKNKSVKNTSKSIIGESCGASTSDCAPRASTLGNMMQDMGIEPSALGWDSEEEDWKD